MSRLPARRSGPQGAHRAGAPDRWLLSYADFITLMFAFFAVMYGVSTVDADKLVPAAASLQSAFSAHAPAPAPVEPPPALAQDDSLVPAAPIRPPTASVLQEVRRRLSAELTEAIESGRLEIAQDARGLVLSLPVEATFAIGSADVEADARTLIGQIAVALGPLGNPMRIEGHTDDLPIRTSRYRSNWELSTARASSVVAFLIDTARVEPARLSAAGYGEFHPRVPNDSAANRARNRRVDIVVLNSATSREEPDAEEQS